MKALDTQTARSSHEREPQGQTVSNGVLDAHRSALNELPGDPAAGVRLTNRPVSIFSFFVDSYRADGIFTRARRPIDIEHSGILAGYSLRLCQTSRDWNKWGCAGHKPSTLTKSGHRTTASSKRQS